MASSLDERKKRLDNFDKLFGQDLDERISQEDSRLRMTLSDGFDREMSLAEKSFAKGDYIEALEHRMMANLIYTTLRNSKL
jgi:hypothetical protein